MSDQPNFIPLDDEPLTPTEELAAVEDLDIRGPDDLVVSEQPPPPVGRSWAFDFIDNVFMTGPQKGPLGTRGDDTLAFWIEKTLRTAKGAHPIYNSEYGMEDPFREIGRAQTDTASLQARIHDALVFHPRIANVQDFVSAQDPDDDALYVSFTVVKDDGTVLPISQLPLS